MEADVIPQLDAHRLREDFPLLAKEFGGKPLSYLNSAATAHKPRAVLDAMQAFYESAYDNAHRGVYELAERATDGLEGARERVRALVNARSVREIIFTRNTTEGMNLVAYSWGLANLGPGDVAVVTELEHHSSFVPWQEMARRTGAAFRVIPVDPATCELDLSVLDSIASAGRVRVVSATLVSNAVGTVNPIDRIGEWAREQGAVLVCDAAQAAPHRALDVQTIGADFLALSGHKLCGPSGASALWGRRELLEAMPPFLMGGHMIRRVTEAETTWADLPAKFEAGTAPIAEAVGLGAAVDYLFAIGFDAIEEHERELTRYALERLGEIPEVTLYGPPPERRSGIVSFNVEGIHPHDVAQILGSQGVAIRAGHHCCQPLMRRLGVAATNRASFYLYTVREDVDRLVEGVELVLRTFA